MKLFSILLLPLFVVALHFRPPLYDPMTPQPFDPDLVELQLRQAPKDAEILFLGDSITERWRFRPELWSKFGDAGNLGVGGSHTANLLWLVESGKLNIFHPRTIVVRIGVNDLLPAPRFWERRKASPAKVRAGTALIAASLHRQFPSARIIIMPLAAEPSELSSDGIHLNDLGYQHWADSLRDQSMESFNQ